MWYVFRFIEFYKSFLSKSAQQFEERNPGKVPLQIRLNQLQTQVEVPSQLPRQRQFAY